MKYFPAFFLHQWQLLYWHNLFHKKTAGLRWGRLKQTWLWNIFPLFCCNVNFSIDISYFTAYSHDYFIYQAKWSFKIRQSTVILTFCMSAISFGINNFCLLWIFNYFFSLHVIIIISQDYRKLPSKHFRGCRFVVFIQRSIKLIT